MDGLQIHGLIEIWNEDKTEKLGEFKNMFLQNGLTAIFKCLQGQVTGLETKGYSFITIGNGSDEVKKSDQKLTNEVFRKGITSVNQYGNKLIVESFIDTSEANFTWTEIGLYSGGTLEAKDSGTLLNRALIKEEKNAGKSKTITWTMTFN